MRVIVVSTPVFPVCPPMGTAGYSGLEVIAWLCAKGLAEKGHQVKMAAPDGSSCPGVEMIPMGQAGHWNEKDCFPRYAQHLLDADAIVDHSWQKHSYLLKQRGQLKAPILGVCHAPVDGMYRTVPVPKPCFVCISNDQASHLKALLNVDCRVAHNGVDTSFYHPLDVARSDRFLFLARFSSIKGPDLALEACYQAGVGLDLIGDTSITQEPDYFRMCCKMAERQSPDWDPAKGKQFRIIGPVSRGNSVWWFSQAHCMVHANQRFREPLGLAPLEAQLCGCPVIAWNNGAMRETLPNNDWAFRNDCPGMLVESMESLVEWVRHYAKPIDNRRRHMCREWASRFSVENMIERYNELIHEAVNSGGW